MSTRKAVKRNNSTKVIEHKPKKKVKLTIAAPAYPSYKHAGVVLVNGAGDFGQLGLGSDVMEKIRPALLSIEQEIIDVCAGGMHTVCLTKDGKVLTFGCNDEGALGRVTLEENDSFVPGVVELPERAVQISAGDSHTAALLANGRVFAWGCFRDSHGVMGLTINGNERLPHEMLLQATIVKIASGADHLVMLTNLGHVFTCGCAEQGQLGRVSARRSDRESRAVLNSFLIPATILTKLTLKLLFDNIWAGTYCTYVKILNKDEIYVFGLNNFGQIGLPEMTAYFAPTLSTAFASRQWKQICGAQHHTIALDMDGKVYALGRKEYGRLGLGNECEDASEFMEIPALADKNCIYVGCCSSTSFAVTDKGELYGWGMGTTNQLGTGDDKDCWIPTLIRSKQLQERLALKVSVGGQHTVILAGTANNNKMKNTE